MSLIIVQNSRGGKNSEENMTLLENKTEKAIAKKNIFTLKVLKQTMPGSTVYKDPSIL